MNQLLKTVKELQVNPISKGDLAKEVYPDQTFDCALPQQWVNQTVDDLGVKHHDVTSQFVWLYKSGDPFGHPAPLTAEAKTLLNRIKQIV